MPLLDRLQDDVKKAMKAGEKARVGTLRMVVAELKRKAIDDGPLDEQAEMAVLQRAVKQRREAAEAFTKGDRAEQAESEQAEAEIISEYLPEPLTEEQLREAVSEAIEATGASTPKDLGKVIGRVRAKYLGRVDGRALKDEVSKQLAD
ncbi:MAG: GatB/YqeY domain-containing protein [Acidobacteriota bacterium]